MCGICGAIGSKKINIEIVKRMNQALIHRGPDGEGEFLDDGIALAMRRLSIIDLKTGWQPLFNEDNSLVLIVNGEIYNYIELRDILQKKGHKFQTSGDGETILHLYEEYGTECLSYLRGMFAFALWDKKRKKLFIARDRMGEKPLYLFHDQNKLLFSSELRSLLASGLIDITLDPASIDMFFHYNYVPEPFTPIVGIRKLPAGHFLLIDQPNMTISEHCYWRMEDAPALTGNPSEMIREKLYEISKLVIRADVPVGVALSGGIDSSIIAAMAVKYYQGNMHAFTIGYEGRPESDERLTAFKIASFLNMPFHEIELSDADFVTNFSKVCSLSDDPIADISGFGYYSISKKAREMGIPVLLQGQGGDELFWGYPWVRKNYSYALLKKKLLEGKGGFLDYYKLTFKERYTKPTIKKLFKALLSYPEAFGLLRMHKEDGDKVFPFYDYHKGFNWNKKQKSNFYGPYMLERLNSFNLKQPFKVQNGWGEPDITLTSLICSTYLLENGIVQGDRLSMANFVELRLPLVDYQLVETVIGLRKSYSDINLPPKAWLNNAAKDILPEWIFGLRKRGFEPPVQRWLDLILQKYGHELPEGILVNYGIIQKDIAVKFSNGLNEPKIFFPAYFNALVLENWFRSLTKT